jgi:G3E family GTPase
MVMKEGDLDLDKFNDWLPQFLQQHGEKLYRMKGFLAIANEPRKFVFQVHALGTTFTLNPILTPTRTTCQAHALDTTLTPTLTLTLTTFQVHALDTNL